MKPAFSRSNSSPLFYAEVEFIPDLRVDIEGEEARHILRSRRLHKGDVIALTNGKGQIAQGRICQVTQRRDGLVASIFQVEQAVKPRFSTVLMSAIPKGDRQGTLLDMATQLGMSHFHPLKSEYSVQKVSSKLFDRWRRIVREASKQCRQPNFPILGDEVEFAEVLSGKGDRALLLYADHEGVTIEQLFSQSHLGSNDLHFETIILLVGPEGGFSESEVECLEKSHGVALALGNHVLRTETAAVAMLAALNQIRYKFEC